MLSPVHAGLVKPTQPLHEEAGHLSALQEAREPIDVLGWCDDLENRCQGAHELASQEAEWGEGLDQEDRRARESAIRDSARNTIQEGPIALVEFTAFAAKGEGVGDADSNSTPRPATRRVDVLLAPAHCEPSIECGRSDGPSASLIYELNGVSCAPLLGP